MTLHWTVNNGAEGYLPKGLLEDPERYVEEQGEIVTKGPRHLTALCNGNGIKLFVKAYRLGPSERLKAFFRKSRAEREWRGAVRLQEAGIAVPPPLAWGIGGGKAFYISQALDGSPLETCIEKNAFLPQIALMLRKMHDIGVFHRDLHGENVLVNKEGKLYLVDLHRHKYYKNGVPCKKRLWDIACLLHSLQNSVSNDDRNKFLYYYCNDQKESLFHQLNEIEKRVFQRHLDHIRHDCQRQSIGYESVNLEKLHGWAVKGDITTAKLKFIIKRHREIVCNKQPELKKISSRSAVTLFYVGEDRICVKEYRFNPVTALKERFRFPKPRRAWVNANILFEMGIGRIKPLAYLEKWGAGLREAYLIVRSPKEYQEMSHYLDGLNDGEKTRRFIEAFAFFLKSLLEKGVWHRDLKAHHVMVAERIGQWDFALIEAEDVRFIKVKENHILRNLAQLNATLPPCINWALKNQFLKALFGERAKVILRKLKSRVN